MGVGAEITLPASKSIVNRLLIIEAISGEKILTSTDICCEDTQYLYQALRSKNSTIDIGESGTAMRFLTAFFSTQIGRTYTLQGKQRLYQRPIGSLVDALRQLGADIEYLQKDGFLPIKIKGKVLQGNMVTVDSRQSSQYVSALMLIAPMLKSGLTIEMNEPSSLPYIGLTEQIMRASSVEVHIEGNFIRIPHGTYKASMQTIESDFSSAAWWFALLAVNKTLNSITLASFPEHSHQPDSRIVEIARQFGISTKWEESKLILTRIHQHILPKSIRYNLNDTPDLVPTLVALCLVLGIEFIFYGVSNLRLKESNRIDALIGEMAKCGYLLGSTNDTIYWTGQYCLPQPNPTIATYSDHRIAMAFALVSEVMPLEIADKDVVAKSYPSFWDDLSRVVG